MRTYTIREYGPHWIVMDGPHEVTRYRKDEIAWNGYTDIDELKKQIRSDLRLSARDRVLLAD